MAINGNNTGKMLGTNLAAPKTDARAATLVSTSFQGDTVGTLLGPGISPFSLYRPAVDAAVSGLPLLIDPTLVGSLGPANLNGTPVRSTRVRCWLEIGGSPPLRLAVSSVKCAFSALRGGFGLPSAQIDVPVGTPLLDATNNYGTVPASDELLASVLRPGTAVRLLCVVAGTRWTSTAAVGTWPSNPVFPDVNGTVLQLFSGVVTTINSTMSGTSRAQSVMVSHWLSLANTGSLLYSDFLVGTDLMSELPTLAQLSTGSNKQVNAGSLATVVNTAWQMKGKQAPPSMVDDIVVPLFNAALGIRPAVSGTQNAATYGQVTGALRRAIVNSQGAAAGLAFDKLSNNPRILYALNSQSAVDASNATVVAYVKALAQAKISAPSTAPTVLPGDASLSASEIVDDTGLLQHLNDPASTMPTYTNMLPLSLHGAYFPSIVATARDLMEGDQRAPTRPTLSSLGEILNLRELQIIPLPSAWTVAPAHTTLTDSQPWRVITQPDILSISPTRAVPFGTAGMVVVQPSYSVEVSTQTANATVPPPGTPQSLVHAELFMGAYVGNTDGPLLLTSLPAWAILATTADTNRHTAGTAYTIQGSDLQALAKAVAKYTWFRARLQDQTASVTTAFRTDIAPGSFIRVDTSTDRAGNTISLYGIVGTVSYSIDAQSMATTTFNLMNVRSAATGDTKTGFIGTAEHPLYPAASNGGNVWNGTPLIATDKYDLASQGVIQVSKATLT